MKLITLCLLLASPLFAIEVLFDGDQVYVDGVSTNNPEAYQKYLEWLPKKVENPAWNRYWWLYAIAQRYGKSLPCDIADLRAAIQTYLAAAPDWQTAAGINADATDATICFTANGGTNFDWSHEPPQYIYQ